MGSHDTNRHSKRGQCRGGHPRWPPIRLIGHCPALFVLVHSSHGLKPVENPTIGLGVAILQYAAYFAHLLLLAGIVRAALDRRSSYRAKLVEQFAEGVNLALTPEIAATVLKRIVRRARAGAVGGVSALALCAVVGAAMPADVEQSTLPWLLFPLTLLGVATGWALVAVSSTAFRPDGAVRIARVNSPTLTDFVSPLTRRILASATLSAPVMWAACAALVSISPMRLEPSSLPIVAVALPTVVAVGIVAIVAERLAIRAATVPRRAANTQQLAFEDALRTDNILMILATPAVLSFGSGAVSLMSTIASRRWTGEDPAASILSNGWAGVMTGGIVAMCVYAAIVRPRRRFHATLWATAMPSGSELTTP